MDKRTIGGCAQVHLNTVVLLDFLIYRIVTLLMEARHHFKLSKRKTESYDEYEGLSDCDISRTSKLPVNMPCKSLDFLSNFFHGFLFPKFTIH